MTCDDGRRAAFVAGQLSAADEHAFDQHLLTCEACWDAVQEDRRGRRALESLRVPAPPGLADRVTLAVSLAAEPSPQPAGRRFRVRLSRRAKGMVTAAAVAVAALAAGLGWTLAGGTAADPPQIARVAAMMSPTVGRDAGLRSGEQFDFGGQHLTVRSYRVEGDVVLVATSDQPFPMPAHGHLLPGSSPQAWMATRDTLAFYGVNHPAGRASMFLVAAMPMAELPQVAALLHVI